MGTVFEAEQVSMRRRVALKVLPFAAWSMRLPSSGFGTKYARQRRLNHPHIVPVYSIGEERGVHFYAMQLIRGRTLADVIDELRAATKLGGNERLADKGRDVVSLHFAMKNRLCAYFPRMLTTPRHRARKRG